MPIRNVLSILICMMVSLACYAKATHHRYATMLTHAMEVIEHRYVEPVEARELYENAMRGMVSRLDEYSDYISADDFQRFRQTIDQQFVGIGVLVEGPPEVSELRVVSPIYDSPAHRAGMRAGDAILEIGGQSTAGLDVQAAIKLIKGPTGTKIALRIRHAGEDAAELVEVERKLIHTRSVLGDVLEPNGQWQYFLEQHPEIGYVRITTFGERTMEELRPVFEQLNGKVKALILDLRGNPGGLLDAGVATCDMLIDQGTIVSVRGRGGRVDSTFRAKASLTLVDRKLPVVVMVDRFSASAAEIVAACLKDHRRATIVGDRTWGKGTVQNVIMLESETSALKLTTATYWRPSGTNIHRSRSAKVDDDWGVRPSAGCEVKLTDQQYRQRYEQRSARDVLPSAPDASLETTAAPTLPTVDDPQLDKAVEYLLSVIAPPA